MPGRGRPPASPTRGCETIGDLAGLSAERIAALIPGRVGELLHARARGVDPRPVTAEPPERISVSSERTFDRDVSDRRELARRGREMAAAVGADLTRRGRCARTVTVKLRYADFTTVTRSATMGAPTDDAAVLWRHAAHLLDAALGERPGALRLLGVGVSGLARGRQLALFPASA